MVDWKKEYKTSDLFKRDKAAGEEQAQPAPVEAEDQPKVPWYKKEVSLKKGKAAAPAAEPAADEPSVPWYKKEVSLGKRQPAVEAVAEPETGEPTVPWYKKEVSLGRSKRAPEPPPVPEVAAEPALPEEPVLPADPEPTPVAEALPEPQPQPEPELERAPEPIVYALPDPEPEPPLQLVPAPEPEPELPPAVEAEPLRPVSWVDAVLQSRLPEPEPVPQASAPEPVAPQPEPTPVAELPAEPEPVPLAQLPPEPEPVSLPAPEPVAAVSPPEPVAASVPDPRPVHPPVTAEELPPLDDEAEQSPVPWYKRELSFGRKREKEPFELDAPKVPFWKKDLSFGRGAKAEPAPAAAEAPSAPAAKVPFWKKELSFGRGAKPAAEAPVAAEAAPEAAPTARKSVPFWKKELSFGRGKAKQPAAETAPAEKPAKPAKSSSKPFWKRELSLNVSLPQRSGGGGGSMPKQLVGLKIGASQVAAARVANNGHAEVLQVAREPLDQGVIVGGELRDPERLAEVLKEFFRRNKLPKKGVRLGIANNRIGVRIFEIAGIDDPKQLANAIRFRAQEALPIPIEEAVLDYQVLEDGVNEEGEPVRKILLVVAYRELVDRYVMACRKAGIALVGIDLEAFALLRALAAPPEPDAPKAAVVAVAVGHDRSTFAVSDGRVCEFTRVLEWGGQNLNVAIARALDVTPSEAEPFKHELSLDGGPVPEKLTAEQAAAAREAAVRQVNTFARELVSSLQFYQSQPGSLGIGEIIVTGGTAHLAGFGDELQRLIGVKVRIGDPLVRVKVPKRFQEPEQIGSLAVAIGLGIED